MYILFCMLFFYFIHKSALLSVSNCLMNITSVPNTIANFTESVCVMFYIKPLNSCIKCRMSHFISIHFILFVFFFNDFFLLVTVSRIRYVFMENSNNQWKRLKKTIFFIKNALLKTFFFLIAPTVYD